jgi:hypothetical protein
LFHLGICGWIRNFKVDIRVVAVISGDVGGSIPFGRIGGRCRYVVFLSLALEKVPGALKARSVD